MDKLCAKCGKQLQPDQGFCDNCGSAWTPTAAGAASNPISAASQPVVQQVAAPAQTSGSSSKTVLIVTIALVVALGIGGWLFLRHRAAAGSSVVSSAATSSSSSTKVTISTPAQPASNVVQPAVGAPGDASAVEVSRASASGETLSATDAASEVAANSKPCSVVTRAEMEKILGSKIVKLTTSDMTCLYFTDETSSAEVETTWTGGKAVFLQMKGYNSAPGNVQPVPGIGDEAYFPVTNVLHVLKGDTYVVVNARVYPNELETESAIARKVMERLK